MNEEHRTKVVTFIPNIEYIKNMRGTEGVNMLFKELKRRGYNYDFRKMNKNEWVPIEVRREFMHIIVELFGWDERHIYNMGLNNPRISPVVKLFFGLFINIQRVFEESPELWRKHYSGGTFEFADFRPGYGKLILRDFDVDPLFCKYLEGYFMGILKIAKVKEPKVVETKCTFRGDEYHEYVGTWK